MTRAGGHDRRTRRRLLEVATTLFAERGFKHVTVRLICRGARANVASVNYHFRDKMGLYREVLQEAASIVTAMTVEAIDAGRGLPVDAQLRAYIEVHTHAMFKAGPKHRLQQLMHRELQEPTAMLKSIIDAVWKPRFEYLAGIVGRLLALPVDDERVIRSVISVHAQVVMFKPSPAHDRMGKAITRVFVREDVARHIVAFSLAGLEAYRAGPRA
jgi:TetR/AcrR family transcriptional regulator, regulator of cefoperazone and chloramphenicol sensitivity